jgi:hypothetical protein
MIQKREKKMTQVLHDQSSMTKGERSVLDLLSVIDADRSVTTGILDYQAHTGKLNVEFGPGVEVWDMVHDLMRTGHVTESDTEVLSLTDLGRMRLNGYRRER